MNCCSTAGVGAIICMSASVPLWSNASILPGFEKCTRAQSRYEPVESGTQPVPQRRSRRSRGRRGRRCAGRRRTPRTSRARPCRRTPGPRCRSRKATGSACTRTTVGRPAAGRSPGRSRNRDAEDPEDARNEPDDSRPDPVPKLSERTCHPFVSMMGTRCERVNRDSAVDRVRSRCFVSGDSVCLTLPCCSTI